MRARRAMRRTVSWSTDMTWLSKEWGRWLQRL
jgi:hypothetical protein